MDDDTRSTNSVECPNYVTYGHGPHRQWQWYDVVGRPSRSHHPWPVVGVIDGYSMVVCRVSHDEKWWIVPQSEDNELNIDDIGPFETMSDAILHLKLSSTEIYDG